jgi:hypothetical protein
MMISVVTERNTDLEEKLLRCVDDSGSELCIQWQDIEVLVLELHDLQPQSCQFFLTRRHNISVRRENNFLNFHCFVVNNSWQKNWYRDTD